MGKPARALAAAGELGGPAQRRRPEHRSHRRWRTRARDGCTHREGKGANVTPARLP